MLIDSTGRIIDYLRISVTDRCDFRCAYCYPPSGSAPEPRRNLLDTDAFVRLARIGTKLGIRKIKLTGGEPLLHRDIVRLVGRLASLPGLEDLSITTNGSRLARLAAALHGAGLRRINLSIDSLRPDRFARLTQGGSLKETLRALDVARGLGFAIKINTVALEGQNVDELSDFVRFAVGRNVEVRFIEFMPLSGHGWSPGLFVSAQTMRARLNLRHKLHPIEPSGVAVRFTTDEGARIGFISTISEPFCDRCRRLRLTAWGALRPCLFSSREIDLSPLLRAGAGDDALREAFVRAAEAKPERNEVLAGRENPLRLQIRSIGG